MIGTHPDIAYGVSLIRKFMSKPSKEHWNAVKGLLRYIKCSSDIGLVCRYRKEGGAAVMGYCDSDYAADRDKRINDWLCAHSCRECCKLEVKFATNCGFIYNRG